MKTRISYDTRRSIARNGSLSLGNRTRGAHERRWKVTNPHSSAKIKWPTWQNKYKGVKDKLRTTGYGKGGDHEVDKETESESDLIPRHFNDVDDILGNREAVNPKHVLESSSYVDSSPENDCNLLDKEALDAEILSAAHAHKERDAPGPSGESTYCADGSDDEDDALASSRSLFFKNKREKESCTQVHQMQRVAWEKNKLRRMSVRRPNVKVVQRNKAQCFRFLKGHRRGMRHFCSGWPKQRKKADESSKNSPRTLWQCWEISLGMLPKGKNN